jgi:hypothetical protein
MEKNERDPYFVDEPLIASSNDGGIEKDTKNAKLASKPKIGEKIVGDDGIKGRMR